MRSIVYGLFMLALSLSPSLAQAPCTETITERTKLVNDRTKGFVPVVLVVRVPVDGDVEAAAKKAALTFSLATRDPQMRNDVFGKLSKIMQCTFTPQPSVRNDKMYLTARTEVVWEWNQQDHYWLRTGLLLPKSLVQKQPAAQSELEDGTVLKGSWGVATYPYYEKRKGKRQPVMVQKQITQLLLEE